MTYLKYFLITSVILLIFGKENSGEGGSGDSDSDDEGEPAEKRIGSAVSYNCMCCPTFDYQEVLLT